MTATQIAWAPSQAAGDTTAANIDRLATGRDRVIDLARAVSMVAVAVGHWLVTDLTLGADGALQLTDVLAVVPQMQLLTWIFQVMPIFFFAGGVVGFASWARHRDERGASGGWIAARLWRLAWPTLPLVGFWVVVTQVGDHVVGLPDSLLAASRGIALVIWFLAVYALVVALVPVMAWAIDRIGLFLPAGLLTLALGVDSVAMDMGGDYPMWVFVNYLLVWGAITSCGFWWPRIARRSDVRRGLMVAIAAGGLLLTAVATQWYPLSMVGVAGAERSNSWPPTCGLALLGLLQIGLLVAARPMLDRWLSSPPTYKVVALLGARSMSIYLWHTLAPAVLALGLVQTGLWPTAATGTAGWWLLRLGWVAVCVAITVPVVLVVGRWERPPAMVLTRSTGAAVVAAAALATGWAALALQGFHVPALPAALPLVAIGGLGVGIVALRAQSGGSTSQR